MRKGLTLIELMSAVGLLTVVLAISAPVFTATLLDIPRARRAAQTSADITTALEQLRRDVEGAVSLPLQGGGFASDEQQLLIESPDGLICYERGDNALTRRMLRKGEADEGGRTFALPDAQIDWKVWRNGTSGYAVEVRTGVNVVEQHAVRHRFANAAVFFVKRVGGGSQSGK